MSVWSRRTTEDNMRLENTSIIDSSTMAASLLQASEQVEKVQKTLQSREKNRLFD
jgi:hypothetical protein